MLLDRYGKMKLSDILHSKLLWIGMIVKVLLSYLAASSYLKDLFIPFVQHSVEIFPANPYNNSSLALNNFPYPALMLWMLMVPGWIVSCLQNLMDLTNNAIYLIYRLPLLVADFTILAVLSRWLKSYTKQVLMLYWLSPVLIYITYIHGQLDVLPIALLFVSLYCAFKNKFILASIVMGMAVATKTHIALIAPLYGIYIWKVSRSPCQMLKNTTLIAAVFCGLNLPYYGPDLYNMVFANPQQLKVFDLKIGFGNLQLFMMPFVLIVVYIQSTLYKFYNKDLFLVYLGFVFGVTTLLIPPMQGWYYWTLPFFIYFNIKKAQSYIGLLALQAAYLMYFALIPESDFLSSFLESSSPSLKITDFFANSQRYSPYIVNMCFTLLQAVQTFMCFWIFKKGVSHSATQKMRSKPFIVGIGGNSGTGKTSITSGLEQIFGQNKTTVLRGDDMHKWERGHEKWNNITHLDPKANLLAKEIPYLNSLKEGRSIQRRHYDHATGKFTTPVRVNPNKLIVFEGLHPFYLKPLRNLFDLKVFMVPDESLYRHWKIIRDMQKRGYSKEKVLQQIQHRYDDTKRYIEEQQQHADIVVSYIPLCPIEHIGNPDITIDLKLKILLPGEVFIDPLLEAIEQKSSCKISHDYDSDGNQWIEFTGLLSALDIDDIAYQLIPQLEDMGVYQPQWQTDYRGVLQLVLIYCIFNLHTIES